MGTAAHLPLFETETLNAIREEREDLLKRLQRGGVDAHTRIKREERLKVLTARQIEIETALRLGRR
ncbi:MULTISPECIES: hypothetical protein [unclassified Shinella]|uniref:hypothetical protein n=1 Tax=unclassified Shinella TaxID=2643062 RepID=UPI00225CB8B4|nr:MULTISPECIES: hypothetical protein [unclassified Shinella]MCO5139012.1 hypothetical protein [Shinella sp.]MCW5711331.1 hypothetical protein [Shinella sp.]MDC7256259.1 hypothetical protein [Shinella sp. YE25]CAI0339116.1 conserved hypothetical protein [Rhizobiaceae bacterium]